jgi:glucose/arabinose dehydrogenase
MRVHARTLLAWSGAALLALAALVMLQLRGVEITSWPMIWNAMTGAPGPRAESATVRQQLVAPAGWRVEVYSADVPKARMLRLTAAGDLLVSQSREGQVTLLGRDADGDGRPDRRELLLQGLDRPHGVEVADGWLYVGESGAVGRAPFDVQTGRLAGEYRHVITGLPEGGNHWSRTVRIGPDGWLYVHVGSSCNACAEEHPYRATLLRARPDGTELAVYASGLRNSVGFDWAPWSGELYATDNGRDLLGDDFPPCELNRIEAGKFYGWPFVNGFNVLDPDMGAGHEALLGSAVAPAHGFRAHNAPLGISFLRHQPEPALARAALVALHGSWNRSAPDGYKVVLLTWAEDGAIRESDFLTGFEGGGNVIGRPVDVAETPDGTLFVSDDYAGAVYRLVRGSASPPAPMPADAPAVAARSAPAESADPLAGIPEPELDAADARAEGLVQRYACASCHAAGTPMAAMLASVAERYTVDTLSAYFVTPVPPMPVLPLDAADRRALALHLLRASLQSARSSSNRPASSSS